MIFETGKDVKWALALIGASIVSSCATLESYKTHLRSKIGTLYSHSQFYDDKVIDTGVQFEAETLAPQRLIYGSKDVNEIKNGDLTRKVEEARKSYIESVKRFPTRTQHGGP